MPVGSNDLGKVSDTTTDLLADVKELSRELNRVNSEIEKVTRKNEQLSPELEKRQKELAALYQQAKGNLLQSSGRALLNPQAAKEVQAEAKKVIDGEIRQIQQKLARTILSGGRVDNVLVGQQSHLQSILNAYESRGQTSSTQPISRAYRAMQERLSGANYQNVMDAAYSMRGRVRQTYGLMQNIANGQFGWRDAMDIQDATELASSALRWGGRGIEALGATGALGKAGRWMLGAGSRLGSAAAYMGTTGGIAALGGVTAAPMFMVKVLSDIEAQTKNIVRTYGGAEQASRSMWGRNRVQELGEMLLGEKSLAVGQGLTAYQAAKLEEIARLAGNEDYKIDPNTLSGYGDAHAERNVAVQHLAKFFGKAERNYNLYADAARRTSGGINTTSSATITESIIAAMKGGDALIFQSIGKKLKEYEDIDKAQETYERNELAQDKQLRWKMRYQERALAELEKQNLLARQDWSRK